jgi:transposase
LDLSRLAACKKNAARLKAWLVFIDETGFLTSPWVRRSWAPIGETPVLLQRTTRQKASAIAALAISPCRVKVRLLFSLRPHQNVNAEWVIAFLRDLGRHLGPRMVVIWDRLNAHKARIVHEAAARRSRLRIEYLPPYAPELNPVEYVWAFLKTSPLANWAPATIEQLADRATGELLALQNQQQLLRSFLRASPLSLRLQ